MMMIDDDDGDGSGGGGGPSWTFVGALDWSLSMLPELLHSHSLCGLESRGAGNQLKVLQSFSNTLKNPGLVKVRVQSVDSMSPANRYPLDLWILGL